MTALTVEAPNRITLSDLCRLLEDPQIAKQLTKLSVNVSTGWRENLPTLANLTYLRLEGNVYVKYFLEIGESATKLEYLGSNREFKYPYDQDAFQSIFVANKNTLKEIHLPNYEWKANDVTALGQCCQLESLSFNCMTIRLDDFLSMPEVIPHLTRLDMSLDFEPKHVAQFLNHPNMSQLTSFRLAFGGKIDTDLMKAIRNCKGLTELRLETRGTHQLNYSELRLVLSLKKLETLVLKTRVHISLPDYLTNVISKDSSSLKFLQVSISSTFYAQLFLYEIA